MKIIRGRTFTASRAWGALDIANMRGITTRLHWTDQPYRWHINDGEEVFVVFDGRVKMRYRENGVEQSTVLETGGVFLHLSAPSTSPARSVRRVFWSSKPKAASDSSTRASSSSQWASSHDTPLPSGQQIMHSVCKRAGARGINTHQFRVAG